MVGEPWESGVWVKAGRGKGRGCVTFWEEGVPGRRQQAQSSCLATQTAKETRRMHSFIHLFLHGRDEGLRIFVMLGVEPRTLTC